MYIYIYTSLPQLVQDAQLVHSAVYGQVGQPEDKLHLNLCPVWASSTDQPPLTGPFRMLVHGWRLG